MKIFTISFLMNLFKVLHIETAQVDKIKYFYERYISRKYPLNEDRYKQKWKAARILQKQYEKYTGKQKGNACYEIGCGRDLATALLISRSFDKTYCLDVAENVKPDLLNHTFKMMAKNNYLNNDIPVVTRKNYKSILSGRFSIEYLAPANARNTPIESDSVDLIYSESVFEHIEEENIVEILSECKRVLSNDGIIHMSIDYSDHLSYADKSITKYNFLKYSSDDWKKYDPFTHVNRLRHSDFLRLFTQCGFVIHKCKKLYPERYEQIVADFPFHNELRERYTIDDLSITGGVFIVG